MTILDLALQMSSYEMKTKLHKYALTQKKVIYARKMGKRSSFFFCGDISAKTWYLTAFQWYEPTGTQEYTE